MPPRTASPPRAPHGDPLAEPLHRLALRLLRALAAEDAASGVSAARLSALSVLVFGGPATPGALARAERVSPPTMTRLVRSLERDGLVRRTADPDDARATLLHATARGTRLLHAARARRLRRLERALRAACGRDRAALERAIPALERVVAHLAGSTPVAGRSRDTGPGRPPRRGRRRLD